MHDQTQCLCALHCNAMRRCCVSIMADNLRGSLLHASPKVESPPDPRVVLMVSLRLSDPLSETLLCFASRLQRLEPYTCHVQLPYFHPESSPACRSWAAPARTAPSGQRGSRTSGRWACCCGRSPTPAGAAPCRTPSVRGAATGSGCVMSCCRHARAVDVSIDWCEDMRGLLSELARHVLAACIAAGCWQSQYPMQQQMSWLACFVAQLRNGPMLRSVFQGCQQLNRYSHFRRWTTTASQRSRPRRYHEAAFCST